MAKKEIIFLPCEYSMVEGYDELIAAKTDKDRKLILDAIAERYKKVDNKQGYYLRLLIDLIKQEVADIKDIETKYYLQELASVHLKTIIMGLIKSMLKRKSLSIPTAEFDTVVETIVDQIFVTVITEYDPIQMMYNKKPPVTIVAFCEKNRKCELSKYKAEESGTSKQNYKVDNRTRKAISALEAKGVPREEITILDIMKEIESQKCDRTKKEFLDDDDISANVSVEVIAMSLSRINMNDNVSSIYMNDSVTPNIDVSTDHASKDFINPESLYIENERSSQIIDALHNIKDETGVKMYLMINGLTEAEDQLQVIPQSRIKDVAEKFGVSVIETRRKIKSVQLMLGRMLKIDDDSLKETMSPIDALLSKTTIPFLDKTDEDKAVEDDFLSIIEINDF